MKSQKVLLPLIDLVFLALGGILAAMTQMERVTTIPVDVTQVGPGAAMVKHGDFSIVTLTSEGMTFDGIAMSKDEITKKVANKTIVFKINKDLSTERMLNVLAELVRAGAQVSVEVKEKII